MFYISRLKYVEMSSSASVLHLSRQTSSPVRHVVNFDFPLNSIDSALGHFEVEISSSKSLWLQRCACAVRDQRKL